MSRRVKVTLSFNLTEGYENIPLVGPVTSAMRDSFEPSVLSELLDQLTPRDYFYAPMIEEDSAIIYSIEECE